MYVGPIAGSWSSFTKSQTNAFLLSWSLGDTALRYLTSRRQERLMCQDKSLNKMWKAQYASQDLLSLASLFLYCALLNPSGDPAGTCNPLIRKHTTYRLQNSSRQSTHPSDHPVVSHLLAQSWKQRSFAWLSGKLH